MNEISSGEPYSITELWKYFVAFDIDDEAEWFWMEERFRNGKAAQKAL